MRQLMGIALLAGVAAVAHAGHGDLGYYVNPSVGFADGDNERGAGDALIYGVAVGRPWSEKSNIELDLRFGDFDEGETLGLGLSLLTYLGENASRVYSIVRAGYTMSDGHPNDDYDALSLGGGLGYRLPLFGLGDLRIEGTLNADIHSNEDSSRTGEKLFFIDPALTLGYQIPLGWKASASQSGKGVAVVDTSADSDDDGVADNADLCPGTPVGTTVDSTGCAPAVAPTVRGECATPMTGDAVDANGCAVRNSTLLTTVIFEFDSDLLTAAAQSKLDSLAGSLAGTTGRIEVAGHASDEGDEYYNVDLSQRRAATVRRYLIDAGVEPGRILSRGYGDDAPATDNDSQSARRENRRVEVRKAL